MKKTKIPDSVIRELSEYLDIGMICYVHNRTHELVFHPKVKDEKMFDDIRAKILNSGSEYIKIEPMSSNDSFRVMTEFAEGIDDEELRAKLIRSLNHPKPIQNFMSEINYSGSYLQDWRDFKLMMTEAWVNTQFKQ